ncbi:hypothetical protein, partial [Clostridium sp. D33t1_170424_F3]|uniref:hypothetical protein n=1 Tax=Clostridium sp. D33t1_170424_F3 TaxID=2787099 RepID=UPI001A9B31A9
NLRPKVLPALSSGLFSQSHYGFFFSFTLFNFQGPYTVQTGFPSGVSGFHRPPFRLGRSVGCLTIIPNPSPFVNTFF